LLASGLPASGGDRDTRSLGMVRSPTRRRNSADNMVPARPQPPVGHNSMRAGAGRRTRLAADMSSLHQPADRRNIQVAAVPPEAGRQPPVEHRRDAERARREAPYQNKPCRRFNFAFGFLPTSGRILCPPCLRMAPTGAAVPNPRLVTIAPQAASIKQLAKERASSRRRQQCRRPAIASRPAPSRRPT
jgi:hypothetical protein